MKYLKIKFLLITVLISCISISANAQDVLVKNNTSCSVTVNIYNTGSGCGTSGSPIISRPLVAGGNFTFIPSGNWAATVCWNTPGCTTVCATVSSVYYPSGCTQPACPTIADLPACGSCAISQLAFTPSCNSITCPGVCTTGTLSLTP